jgi:hypothetical protein
MEDLARPDRVGAPASKIVGTIFLRDRRDSNRFHPHRLRDSSHGVGDVEPLADDDDDAFVRLIEAREQRAKKPIRSILVHFHVVGVVGAHQVVGYDHVAAQPGNRPFR